MTQAQPVSICLVGAGGRMGRRVAALMAPDGRFRLAAAVERPGLTLTAAELGGADVLVTDDPRRAIAAAQVVIDFSAPAAATTLAPLCAEQGAAYLCASTALGSADEAALAAAASRCAVFTAANLSLGVNVMLELVQLAAERLGAAFDVEIGEIHHRHKRDAPSGTALALGAAVERGRHGLRPVLGRAGTGPARKEDELGYAALRGGDVAGEHTVYFFGEAERLEITHRAGNPDIFARGALRAAAWLASQKPGRYTMRDVLAAPAKAGTSAPET